MQVRSLCHVMWQAESSRDTVQRQKNACLRDAFEGTAELAICQSRIVALRELTEVTELTYKHSSMSARSRYFTASDTASRTDSTAATWTMSASFHALSTGLRHGLHPTNKQFFDLLWAISKLSGVVILSILESILLTVKMLNLILTQLKDHFMQLQLYILTQPWYKWNCDTDITRDL